MNSPVTYLCVLAMFISLLMLFFNSGFEKANRFLAGFLFFSGLYILFLYIFLFSTSVKLTAISLTSVPSCFFLVGPLSYFYVRSILTDNPTLSKQDYLHFVLFIICFTGTIPFLLSSWSYKLMVAESMQLNSWNLAKYKVNSILPYKINQGIRPFHIAFYMIAQWRIVWKYFKKNTDSSPHSLQWNTIKKWLLIYCSIFTLLCVCFSLNIIHKLVYTNKSEFLAIALNVLTITTVGYSCLIATLLFFPQVIYGLPIVVYHHPSATAISLEENAFSEKINDTTTINNEDDTLGDTEMAFFTEEYKQEIKTLLHQYITSGKHLSVNCTIGDLSAFCNVASHHLSYYFNYIINSKFTDWRNNNRIDFAIFMIDSGALNNLTLEAIATKSGFTTQSTFIRAFKQKTGMTPSAYVKQAETM